jgi:hypothetical protein
MWGPARQVCPHPLANGRPPSGPALLVRASVTVGIIIRDLPALRAAAALAAAVAIAVVVVVAADLANIAS